MGAKWGTLGPWKAQTEAAAIAPNQKVVDKFFKVCAEGEVARQGVWPQCPVSPLLSPLLIFFSFFSKSFSSFLSLTLSFFLPLLFSFTFYHFLLVSIFHSPFFLLIVSLSLPLFLPFSLFSPPSFFARSWKVTSAPAGHTVQGGILLVSGALEA